MAAVSEGKHISLHHRLKICCFFASFVDSVRESVVHIPTRAEISESDKWDLAHLFADVSKWQEDFAWIQKTYPQVTGWKGKLGASANNLAECLEFEKALDLRLERVYHFASLQLAEDSANTEYLARVGQIQNLFTKIGEAFAFVVPEIQAIDDHTFAKFIVDPALADWRIKLHKIRRLKPHVLSEPEERILALGAAALNGYDDTFSQLTDVDMKFGVLTDETGREKPLTQSSFSSFLVKRVFGQSRRFSRACPELFFVTGSGVVSRRSADFGLPRLDQIGACEFFAVIPVFRIAKARAETERASSLRHLCADGGGDRDAYFVRSSRRSCGRGVAAARKRICRCLARWFARPLVRSLRNKR